VAGFNRSSFGMQLYNATLNTIRGLSHGVKNERALRQEAVVFIAAVPAGAFLAPGVGWYVAMIACLIAVLAIELLNTAIEKLADHVTRDRHPQIGLVKDYGSAAVFCALSLAGLVWLAALALRLNLL
jgi:diacylglycerol kinase (ATP)